MAEAAGTDGATVDTIYPMIGKKYKFILDDLQTLEVNAL